MKDRASSLVLAIAVVSLSTGIAKAEKEYVLSTFNGNIEATDDNVVVTNSGEDVRLFGLNVDIWIAKYSSYFDARQPPGNYGIDVDVICFFSLQNWWPVESFVLITPSGERFESSSSSLKLGLTSDEFETYFIYGDYEICATWLYDGAVKTTVQDFSIGPSHKFLDIPYVISPAPESDVPAGDITVSWKSVAGATEYYADLGAEGPPHMVDNWPYTNYTFRNVEGPCTYSLYISTSVEYSSPQTTLPMVHLDLWSVYWNDYYIYVKEPEESLQILSTKEGDLTGTESVSNGTSIPPTSNLMQDRDMQGSFRVKEHDFGKKVLLSYL